MTVLEYETQEGTTYVQDALTSIQSFQKCVDKDNVLLHFCENHNTNGGEGRNIYINNANGEQIHSRPYFRLNTLFIYNDASQNVKDMIDNLTINSTRNDVEAVFKAYIDEDIYLEPVVGTDTYEVLE